MKSELIDTPRGPMTRSEAAAAFGINKNTLIRRIWKKWSTKKIFSGTKKEGKKPKIYITHEGKRKALRDVVPVGSKAYYRALKRRGYGWPEDEWLIEPLDKKGSIKTPWGMLSINKASDKIGVTPNTLIYRLKNWPIEYALNTPGNGVRGKHFIMSPEEFRKRMNE